MPETIEQIPIEQIVRDPHQPRQTFTDAELTELAESIRVNGLIQPIEVRPMSDGWYMLIAGERRWRAHQVGGIGTIRAIVNTDPLAPVALGVRQYAENAERQDLNIIDEAEWFQWMLGQEDEDGRRMNVNRLARMVNRSSTYINHRLTWLKLEKEIQALVRDGRLQKDERVAKALLSVPDVEKRISLAEMLATRNATIPAIEAACGKVRQKLEAAAAGNGILSNASNVPMVALALNGSAAPSSDSLVPPKTVRDAARQMCRDCSLSDLVTTPEPAWHLLMEKVGQTCKACNIDDIQVCQECPGVDLLRRLATAVEGVPA